ncbi:MAG: indole-3-glycerol-phosphate synthase TrpC, partial [Woeseiaceae bacterium]|nr:indole-3-glycerol-phosphate synthase TrpC [Woeseiaceae bacterium]
MSDFLHEMARLSAQRAAALAPIASAELDKPVVELAPGAFDVIAEIKSRSPAEGELAGRELDFADRARQYASAGAVAISVLTEPTRFEGDVAHLEQVVAAVPDTPVMRKDFLVDELQVLEA